MNRTFLRSTFAFFLIGTLLTIGCADTAPTVAPELGAVIYEDGDGNQVPLDADHGNIVDYSARETEAAVAAGDEALESIGNTVNAAGHVVLTFTQLLDGSSVQTPDAKKQTINGKEADLKVGKGDWENAITVIEGFTPKNDIISLTELQDVPDDSAPTVANVAYRPDGGIGINAADRIDQYPKPAVVVEPAEGAFLAGSVVILHVLAGGIKGISGKTLAPAKDKNGKDIVLADGRKVAATIVFRTDPPAGP